MNNKEGFIYNNLGIICSCVITAVLLLVVYALRGIYPFGTGNISYYDMSQSNVPSAYYVYDFLHGDVGMWLNWQLGAGATTVDAIGNSILSPFNLLFLFISRSKILECMSWLLLVKLCACATSMSFYSQKTFVNLGAFWHTIIGLLYVSGGYVLQYYTNIHFLDIVALFPLVVYGCDRLLNEGKPMLYILFMSLGLINNIQMMSMVCWFVVLYSSYPIYKMEKEKRKRACLFLGISTAIAICISACITLPVLSVLLNSGRSNLPIDKEFERLYGILINESKNAKLFMVYGSEIGIAALIYRVVATKCRVKEVWKYLRMEILLLLPIPFEMVNHNWHIGGYVQFPMRFAYMLTFIGLAIFGNVLSLRTEQVDKNWKKYAGLLSIAGIPFLAISLYGFTKLFAEYGIRDDSNFRPYWSLLFIIIVISLLCLCSAKQKIFYCFFGLLAILQFSVGWYGFLAPEYETSPECTDDIVYNSEKLRGYLREDGNDTYNFLNRIKDNSVSLNSNYGEVVGRSSIASWSYGINPNMVPFLQHLGYDSCYIRTLDGGGTVFTDAFFNMGTVVSYEKMNESLYEFESKVDKYYINNAKYLYPFGTVVSETSMDPLLANEDSSVYEWQNALFKLISDENNVLIDTLPVDQFLNQERFDEEIGGTVYEYSIPVRDKSIVYLSVPLENQYLVWLNGESVVFHDLAMPDNLIYPGFFVSGLISLGVYENDNIELKIASSQLLEENVAKIGLLSLDKLSNSIECQNKYIRNIQVEKNGLSMEIDGVEKDRMLLFPIAKLNDFHIVLNGRNITSENALKDALVMIELDEGFNEIKIKYVPRGLYLGIVLSCIGILLFVVFLKYKERISSYKYISTIFFYTFFLLYCGLLIAIYIYPIIYTIYINIKYRGI